eukprot:5515192-Pyramimonas_sp.AAC.1
MRQQLKITVPYQPKSLTAWRSFNGWLRHLRSARVELQSGVDQLNGVIASSPEAEPTLMCL